MEIYCQEFSRGNLNIEVSIHDTVERDVLAIERSFRQPPFHVFLTARDESLRKVWSTPVMSEGGGIKPYVTFDDALADARNKIG